MKFSLYTRFAYKGIKSILKTVSSRLDSVQTNRCLTFPAIPPNIPLPVLYEE